ncbi:MAG: Phytanoyl-CoA dioxygenase (PhyH) [Acidimicrobiales bacterium]|nr:Phytanoyl-CoA dioxygenase (PhyH) [Acidimicrobiales bacterium]
MDSSTSVVLPDLTAAESAAAARSVGKAGSIGFRIGSNGRGITYSVVGESVRVDEDLDGADTIVALSDVAWADFVAQMRTFINLFLAGELAFERGTFNQLSAWDPALRLLHAGISIYDPSTADFQGRDPQAVLSLACDDAELRAQLDTMGYLHLRGVFSVEEMTAADAEIDRLASLAAPGDEASWWARDETDNDVLCRLVYASMRSDVLAALENDPRIVRLGRLIEPAAMSAPDRMEGAAVLLKAPGETKGLSNIPWHQDCGMGGHAMMCPALSIGIQITGSSAATGNLRMIPGSHGQTMHYQWESRLGDVPVVEIDTAPGDVTVHIQDVMHASPKPTGAGGRRTMYVTFYPPRLWDHVGPGEAFNDLVRNRTAQVADMHQHL